MNYPKINSRWVRGDNKYTPEMGDYNGYTVIHITNVENTHKHHPPHVVYQGDNKHIWSIPAHSWPGNLIPEQSTKTADQDNLSIYSICVAYEQGVGKGRATHVKKKINPYYKEKEPDTYQAWEYGWIEGTDWLTQRIQNPVKE